MKELLDLFIIFARIGGFTFGGGYAMLPIIQREIVDKRGWATNEEILNYYAVGQCTPGIIAVNTATFIGYKQRGIIGGILATAGVVFPSFVIITIIASFIKNFAHLEIVQNAFSGIRVAVCATIVFAIYNMWKKSIKDWVGVVFCLIAFGITAFTPISPVYIILLAGLGGIFVNFKKGESK